MPDNACEEWESARFCEPAKPDKEIVDSWGLLPPDYHIKLWHTLKNNLSIDDFNLWYVAQCKKAFGDKCKHRMIDDSGICHIFSSCPFYKLKKRLAASIDNGGT